MQASECLHGLFVTAYFTATDELVTTMGERAGAPGLDEHQDTYWVIAKPYENIVFLNKKEDAIALAEQEGNKVVYEARFEEDTCLKVLNCALNDNVEDLHFMIKPILQLL